MNDTISAGCRRTHQYGSLWKLLSEHHESPSKPTKREQIRTLLGGQLFLLFRSAQKKVGLFAHHVVYYMQYVLRNRGGRGGLVHPCSCAILQRAVIYLFFVCFLPILLLPDLLNILAFFSFLSFSRPPRHT